MHSDVPVGKKKENKSAVLLEERIFALLGDCESVVGARNDFFCFFLAGGIP